MNFKKFLNSNNESIIKKIQKAEAYSNPGSRNSMLGGSEPAQWGVFDSKNRLKAKIVKRQGIWVITDTEGQEVGRMAYKNIAKAKAAAEDMFKV